ncbi:MAG TPA: sulfite exporter TauE/SafE family protein [Anaerolineales bacterium]|nr:sulfite exporter TauE/SafE family protein [Anaerolineales bacterium]
MLASFLLGLLGSLGHCVGMCSAVVVLLDRQSSFQGNNRSWVMAHLGRITTYALLGLTVGLLGQSLYLVSADLPRIQGILSILFAIIAFYMALAFIGFAKSPELLLSGLVSKWGQTMRRLNSPAPFVAGMLWGLLPCGLVLTALIPAVTAGSASQGALNMIVFGAATIPSLFAVRWLAQRTISRTWSRSLASIVMMVLGFQFAMRGFASLGMVGHVTIGSVVLW